MREFAVAVSSGGTRDADFTEVLRGSLRAAAGPQRFPLPPGVRGKLVRLQLLSSHADSRPHWTLGEFELYDPSGRNLAAWRAADRSLDGPLAVRTPLPLTYFDWSVRKLHDSRRSGASGVFATSGRPPLDIPDPQEIVDLTANLNGAGRLRWEAPPGSWTVLRFVCMTTGERLKVPGPASDGLASDKLNPEATRLHFNHVIAQLRQGVGENLPRSGVGDLYLPSYEVVGKSWSPSFADEFQRRRGYAYDVANADIILNRLQVRDGRLVVPGGGGYAVLVLPQREDIHPAVLERVADFVAAGAAVIGPRPNRASGLEGFPRSDARVRDLAARLWGDLDGASRTSRKYGAGRIVSGRSERSVLEELGIKPDFVAPLAVQRLGEERASAKRPLNRSRLLKNARLTLEISCRAKAGESLLIVSDDVLQPYADGLVEAARELGLIPLVLDIRAYLTSDDYRAGALSKPLVAAMEAADIVIENLADTWVKNRPDFGRLSGNPHRQDESLSGERRWMILQCRGLDEWEIEPQQLMLIRRRTEWLLNLLRHAKAGRITTAAGTDLRLG